MVLLAEKICEHKTWIGEFGFRGFGRAWRRGIDRLTIKRVIYTEPFMVLPGESNQ
jgi:hypothetical protein